MNAAAGWENDVFSGELILVSRRFPFKRGESISGSLCRFGGAVRLQRQCAQALSAALEAVSAQERIVPVSGWRSEEEQRKIYGNSLIKEGEEFTKSFVALPGCSEHQTGLAIDLGERRENIDFIRPEFPDEGVCGSFRQSAPEFGFIVRYPKGAESITEIAWEPWHFRYVGYPHSVIISGMGMTLEEYHEFIKSYAYGQQPLVFIGRGRKIEISYLPADDGGFARIDLDENAGERISGNNMDGFVITAWR